MKNIEQYTVNHQRIIWFVFGKGRCIETRIYLRSFSKSLISARSVSWGEGLGAEGGEAAASLLLRKELTVLMTINMAAAIMVKSITVCMKLP
jgi:hypothetical protein